MSAAWDGRPEQPERDGWHWLHHPEDLRPCPAPWDAAHGAWCSGGMHSPQGVVDLGYRYLGPALLPVEVAAREAAAERRGIERALEKARAVRDPGFPDDSAQDRALRGHYNSGVTAAVTSIRALLREGER